MVYILQDGHITFMSLCSLSVCLAGGPNSAIDIAYGVKNPPDTGIVMFMVRARYHPKEGEDDNCLDHWFSFFYAGVPFLDLGLDRSIFRQKHN